MLAATENMAPRDAGYLLQPCSLLLRYVACSVRRRIYHSDCRTAFAVFNILTDFVIFALPMFTLWRMKMPTSQRNAVLATLLIGGVATVIGCIRLYSVHQNLIMQNATKYNALLDLWSTLEVDLGIICGSAPGEQIATGIEHIYTASKLTALTPQHSEL